MNQSPVKTILMPALLTASIVFGISVTAVTRHGTLPSIETPQEITLREQYRNLAVRNIGLCILTSALSGLAVAGGLRQIQIAHKKSKHKHDSISRTISDFFAARPD